MQEIRKLIGNKIRARRLAMNLSQREFSLQTGISRNQLRGVESGQTNMSIDMLYKIAEALEIEAKELLP